MPRNFTVEGRCPSLNEWATGNWRGKAHKKKLWQEMIAWALLASKIPKKLSWPIEVRARVCTKRARDIDNNILAVKFLNDTLVSCGYIPNDTAEYVTAVTILWSKSVEERVEYEIIETIKDGD